MPRFRNAVNSSSEASGSLALCRSRADPWLGSGIGIAAAHQLHEFLRSRLVAAVAALLRHRAANLRALGFQRILFVDPRLGRAVTSGQTVEDRLAGFAGRGFIANIDVAIAHDWNPWLSWDHNAQLPRKVATPFD